MSSLPKHEAEGVEVIKPSKQSEEAGSDEGAEDDNDKANEEDLKEPTAQSPLTS